MTTETAGKTANELTTIEQPQQAGILGVIERASRDPSINIESMERLLVMYRDERANQAKILFDDAMSNMQPEMPVIRERGKAIVQGSIRYTYALWEDVNEQIKPVLAKHGFSITFRTDFKDGISVTGVLSHRAGHREETSILLPADVSGNKNAVQAVASTVSYGKRYTAGALLNLTTHGEDDDAYRAAPQPQHGRPNDGAFEAAESIGWPKERLDEVAMISLEYWETGDVAGAHQYLADQHLPAEAKIALFSMFDSKFRSALKKHKAS